MTASMASLRAREPVSSDNQTQMLELKKHNDELEDEVSLLCCVCFGRVQASP